MSRCARDIHSSPLISNVIGLQRALGEAGHREACCPQSGELGHLRTPSPPLALTHSPQDVVHTHDALGLQVARIVDDRALCLQPHVAPMLGQHPVLAAHHLALSAH